MISRMKRIVVALDGTADSEEAFAALIPIARADNPKVSVLYVFEAPAMSYFPPPRLAAACAAAREDGIDAHLTICEGKPAEEILRYVKVNSPDLLVMSTRGRKGLERIMEGSVAEEVLRHSDTPVLLVRPGGGRRTWNRILVGLDGSRRSETILPEVVSLALRFSAVVELVRVVLPPIPTVSAGDVPGSLYHEDPRPYLRQVQSRLLEAGVDAQIAAPAGPSAATLVDRAKETGASLICLTSQGRTGLERVLMGSTAEEVVRNAPCPVLIRRCRQGRDAEFSRPPGESRGLGQLQ